MGMPAGLPGFFGPNEGTPLMRIRLRPLTVSIGIAALAFALSPQAASSAAALTTVSIDDCVYNSNTSPTAQIGATLYSPAVNTNLRLLCGGFSTIGGGMRHESIQHSEVLNVQGDFLKCLNFVIRHVTSSKESKNPNYRELNVIYSTSFGSGIATVQVWPAQGTVVTAYVSPTQAAVRGSKVTPDSSSPAQLEQGWRACGAD